MAPKKQAANGFMIFTFEWRGQHKGMSLAEATANAGEIWKEMSADQRAPYNEKAKFLKSKPNDTSFFSMESNSSSEESSSPMSKLKKQQLDREEYNKKMLDDIEAIVANANHLEQQPLIFIMINYFAKTIKGGYYLPAEISLIEYSLRNGIVRKYHSFVNPGSSIFGRQYEAQSHANTSHRLPLPPCAMGPTNLDTIYTDLLDFIRNVDTGEYPPIFTLREYMPIVVSALDYFKHNAANESNRDNELKIYSIHDLFYSMKMATCEIGKIDKPMSRHITDVCFDRDFFEHESGIACDYHELIDRSKYCTLSFVIRWGYTFSDYMCADVGIDCIAGCHVPVSIKNNRPPPPPSSVCHDTESFISLETETSYATKALSEYKIYDEQKSLISEDLCASLTRKIVLPTALEANIYEDLYGNGNRSLDNACDYASTISSRGRGQLLRSLETSSSISVSGRGRLLRELNM